MYVGGHWVYNGTKRRGTKNTRKNTNASFAQKAIPTKNYLWLDKKALNIKDPLVLTPKDGRVIFVIPGEHAILVGTTEYEEDVAFNVMSKKLRQLKIRYEKIEESEIIEKVVRYTLSKGHSRENIERQIKNLDLQIF